ncbi:DUF4169 family protein [Mesorhizobium kowhaii]|uniref:DUF4169 domain-containing protein n=1 Tax=Mesorhizobium kowhaii TaxID=1300272 RepID=A0A2W7C0Q3_9HYPH|nr:DUF4169 family protein [Mesorhizobium kowhaii]PZV35368.1 hypothetical protein B5V02_27490 [Mesorhizobium kowhaii]
MADIVNLRQARKQKARDEKVRVAEQNRALHGRSKAEKKRDRTIADKSDKFVAGHRREPLGDNDSQSIGPKSAQRFSDESDA